MGWGGGSGGAAVAGGEDGWDGVGGDAAGSDLDEGADEVADHVVKEAVAGDFIEEEVVLLAPGGVVESAGVCRWWGWIGLGAGCEVGVSGGEGGEVVSAEDVGGGLLEEGEVERKRAGPDVGSEHGGADAFAGEDAVLVGFAEGAVAGVEVWRCGGDGEDADAGRESVVEGAVEIGGGDGDGEGEGGYLGEGVDTGVGASGALGKYVFAGDAVDGLCECALDGGELGLDLPAVVGGSVVAEDDLPVRHGSYSDGIMLGADGSVPGVGLLNSAGGFGCDACLLGGKGRQQQRQKQVHVG